jgi:exopolysaccharide production protein ExoZ
MKLLGVEAGRGIAALLVVLVHASAMLAEPKYFGEMPFDGIFRFAHAGVDFFFVLSGFIIYYVHRRDIGVPDRLPGYATKRFVRIYPAYWVVCAIFAAILVYSPTRERTEQDLGNIVTSLTLLPAMTPPILGVAWSLKHEILFYTLFGLLFLNRRLGRAALGIWAALIAWNIAVTWVTGHPWFGGIAGDLVFRIFNIEFFFGLLVAHLVLNGRLWHPLALLVLGTLLFFGNGLLESWGPEMPVEYPPRHLAYAAGAALALYGLATAEKSGRLRVPAALVALGTASYSIYLLHVILIMIMQQGLLVLQRFVPLQLELTFLVVVVATVAICMVFCRLVEQPLLRRMRRRPAGAGHPARAPLPFRFHRVDGAPLGTVHGQAAVPHPAHSLSADQGRKDPPAADPPLSAPVP